VLHNIVHWSGHLNASISLGLNLLMDEADSRAAWLSSGYMSRAISTHVASPEKPYVLAPRRPERTRR
jgi:hypothetical protein